MDSKEQQPTTEISTETTPWDDLATEVAETDEAIGEEPEPEPKPTPKCLEGIEQIQEQEGTIVTREQLGTIIEAPCLPACIALYDKNIRTVSSSANQRNNGENAPANIHIDYDYLSDRNKAIAQQLVDEGLIEQFDTSNPPKSLHEGHRIHLDVPLTQDDTAESITAKFMVLVDRFEEQDVMFGRYDGKEAIIDAIRTYFEHDIEDDSVLVRDENGEIDYIASYQKLYGEEEDIITFAEEWYSAKYDKETDAFWANEELLEKHKKYVAEHPEAK